MENSTKEKWVLVFCVSGLFGTVYGQRADSSPVGHTLKRREWFYQQRAYPHDFIPPNARLRALEELDRMIVERSAKSTEGMAAAPAAWTLIGPRPTVNGGIRTSGMTTSIAVDPRNASLVYVGTPDGGVWKTTDAGAHWVPLTDSEPSMSIGSIALDPIKPDTVYVGTGSYLGTGSGGFGAGILKSIDGGNTWINYPGPFVGPTGTDTFCGAGAEIVSLAIDPGNPQVLLAGVFRCSTSTGIYRSPDGGVTWTQVFSGSEATAILFDPATPNVAYASIGRFFTDPSNGVWKSTDDGKTWTALNGGGMNTLPLSGATFVFLTQSRSTPTTMYVSMPTTNTNRLFKTTDGGANWLPISLPPLMRGIVITVHPTNPNILFAGGEFVYRSMDGGITWVDVTGGANGVRIFGDIRSYAFSSGGAVLYMGDDGGPHSTVDAANSTLNWANLSDTLAITEFYPGLSIHPTNINITFGGTQDQGIQKYAGSLTWNTVAGCDGFETAIDYVVPTNVYADCNHNVTKSTAGGNPGTWVNSQNGINSSDRAPWVRPLVIDPSNSQRLYYGTYRLYQTNDGAGTWAAISGDLTKGGTLSAIAAAYDSNTVYVGTSDGRVQLTTNASAGQGTVWTDRSAGLPLRTVTQFAVDPVHPTTAYVTFSGYSYSSDTQGHVFKTTNAGLSWTDISGNLPNTPTDDIVIDPDIPNTLYVATDIGVFQTQNGGASWIPIGTALPRVEVTALRLHHTSRTLRVGTFGRGVWDLWVPLSGQVQISIVATTTGAPFSLEDGSVFQAPITFSWTSGAQHTVTWLSTIASEPGTRYVFQSWTDSGGNPRTITVPSASATYTAKVNATSVTPTLTLNRTVLNFGVSGSSVTSAQTILVAITGGVNAWTATSDHSNITVNPGSGVGTGTFQISATQGSSGIVTVAAPGAINSPQTIQVNIASVTPTMPFGSFDTPLNNTTGVVGAIPVTGWALDLIEVTRVDILREPVTGEPQGNLILIGSGVFVADARPDVAAMFPAYPFQYRAGWGYQLLTNFLPNSSGSGPLGNGTYKLHAIAVGKSGSQQDLGTRTITVDNAHAAKPFGTLDTPGQGGTISGSDSVNFGWALTPQPAMIPTDGSTITIVLDGVPSVHPVYNQFRSDIASLFPGYANSMGAVGFIHLNTTTLANGVHTISWNAFDNLGRGEGLGSRYFNVLNTGGSVAAPEDEIPDTAAREGVMLRHGLDIDRQPDPINPDADGSYSVTMEEMGRIELHLGAIRGHLLVLDEAHALPTGSTLKGGIFYWQPGPGFLGEYTMQFERPDGIKIPVRVNIVPKRYSIQ